MDKLFCEYCGNESGKQDSRGMCVSCGGNLSRSIPIENYPQDRPKDRPIYIQEYYDECRQDLMVGTREHPAYLGAYIKDTLDEFTYKLIIEEQNILTNTIYFKKYLSKFQKSNLVIDGQYYIGAKYEVDLPNLVLKILSFDYKKDLSNA